MRETLAKRVGGGGVELDRDQAAHLVPQPFGRRAGTGADLEHVLAEVDTGSDHGQDVVVQVRGPFGGAEQVSVVFVHSK